MTSKIVYNSNSSNKNEQKLPVSVIGQWTLNEWMNEWIFNLIWHQHYKKIKGL
jgi:hypothetical protein